MWENIPLPSGFKKDENYFEVCSALDFLCSEKANPGASYFEVLNKKGHDISKEDKMVDLKVTPAWLKLVGVDIIIKEELQHPTVLWEVIKKMDLPEALKRTKKREGETKKKDHWRRVMLLPQHLAYGKNGEAAKAAQKAIEHVKSMIKV